MKLILSSLALFGLASAQSECALEQPACQKTIKGDVDTYGTVLPTCFGWKKPVKCINKNAPSEEAKQFALNCVDAALEFKNCFTAAPVEVAEEAKNPAADAAGAADATAAGDADADANAPCPKTAPKCVANINKWKAYKKVRQCLDSKTESAFTTCKNNKGKKLNADQKTFLANCYQENNHFETCVEPLAVCPACECDAASQEAAEAAAATTQPSKVDQAISFGMAKCLIESFAGTPTPAADMFDSTVEEIRRFCAMFAV